MTLQIVRVLAFATLVARLRPIRPRPIRLRAEPKLLEPERAFAFSVQAVDEKTVEARFAIASGYYLYREKLKFSRRARGARGRRRCCPPGTIKDDAFFGNVETYRGRLAVRLPLDGAEPGRKVTVRAESQGCADAGVCYPPQVQHVTVALPGAGRPARRPGGGNPGQEILVQLAAIATRDARRGRRADSIAAPLPHAPAM